MKLKMDRWRRTKARATDPVTSHQAVAVKTEATLNEQQDAVLRVIREWDGRMCDRDLLKAYERHWMNGQLDLPMQSPSGIRTRRNELVKAGKVADIGIKTTLDTGRQAIVWYLVDDNN